MTGSPDALIAGGDWGATRSRVVAVIAVFASGREQVGTGYLVGKKLVLTAAHCTWDKNTHETPIRLRVRRASDGATAEVTEVVADADFDVATLQLASVPWTTELPSPVFARVDRAHAGMLQDCEAIGYPLYQRRPNGEWRGTGELHCTIYLTDEAESGKLLMHEPLIRPGPVSVVSERGSGAAVSSPWDGLSGALLFHRGLAIGLIVEHDPGQGRSALRALTFDRLADRAAQFKDARRVADTLELPPVESLPWAKPDKEVWSAYVQQVLRIAPEAVRDRVLELAELSQFCTGDEGPYAWWQADAWAGKSALMSWFVLHPPPGVRIVSFFITAQFPGQGDRAGFVDAVLEQLAEVVGRPLPPHLNDANGERHLLDLLDDAARTCRQRGERLVLVVDGLDEDLGVTGAPMAYSIAALLPVRPQQGMRVIVTGRPDPPLPNDVPDDHPLRSPGIVRFLKRSEYARVIRKEAEREVRRLRSGSSTEQNVLGLLTAAGGGLSIEDVAELADLPAEDVKEALETVAGRTFRRQNSLWQPDTAPKVYGFAHKELPKIAADILGSRLDGYRQQIHTWAESYRHRHWPNATPEYLLNGYHGLLVATGDVPRMVALAADVERHDRMLYITRGDHSAVKEIIAAQQVVLAQPRSDLVAMARLAIYRSALADRNAAIPTGLPAIWAMLGQPARGEALALSITGPYGQATALTALVEAVAGTGDLDRARVLAEWAETAARSITEPYYQSIVLTDLVDAVAVAGDPDRAKTLAQQAETQARRIVGAPQQEGALRLVARAVARSGDLDRAAMVARSVSDAYGGQAQLLAELVEAAVGAGEPSRATALAHEAEVMARSIADPAIQSWTLARLASVVAAAGDLERKRDLLQKAVGLAGSITDPDRQAVALNHLVNAVGDADDLDRAVRMADSTIEPDKQTAVLTVLVQAMAAVGSLDRARVLAQHAATVAGSIKNITVQAQAMSTLVKAMAATGDLDRARDLAQQTEAVARSITDTTQQEAALGNLAEAAAAAGNLDRAEHLARSITDTTQQEAALGNLAEAAAAAGNLDRATSVAQSITDPAQQGKALTALASAAAGVGDVARAIGLAEQAETAARSITNTRRQPERLAALADSLVAANDLDRAETVARLITDPTKQAPVLTRLVEAMAGAGDRDRAAALARDAENAASSIAEPYRQGIALTGLVKALAGAGELDQAKTVAGSITDAKGRAEAFTFLVLAAADTGNVAEAEALAQQAETAASSISHPVGRAGALRALAEAAARAGNLDRAMAVAGSITDTNEQAAALRTLVELAARAGDLDRAMAVADSITLQDRQDEALGGLVEAAASAGDADRAIAVARSISDPDKQGRALKHLVWAVAYPGNVVEAERMARSMTGPSQQAAALSGLAEALVAAGELNRAETVARSITDPNWHDEALTSVTEALVTASERDRAETVARLITDPTRRAYMLIKLVAAMTQVGDGNEAAALARDAETAASFITDSSSQAMLLTALVEAEAAVDLDRAESVASAITSSEGQAQAFTALVKAAAHAGDIERAIILAKRAEAAARTIGDWSVHAALIDLVEAMANAGDLDRAEKVAHSLDAEWKMIALQTLVNAAARAGNLDRAATVASSITDPNKQAETLTALAKARARAGDWDGAERQILSITDLSWQAVALTDLARNIEPARARALLARALYIDDWTTPLAALVQVEPSALGQIADIVSVSGTSK